MRNRSWRRPLCLSGFILFLQAFPIPSSVREAATVQWVSGFTMHYPLWHVVWTPFCGIADVLTVLSYHQVIVFGVWAIVLLLAIGGFRRFLPCFFLLLLFLAWGGLVPRPMGRLVAKDSDILLIDFHSHTQISHDGRPSFSPAANMAWHQNQGYNAAFITDHNRTEAASWAKEDSKHDWKETGYRSLEGEEISLSQTHLVLLGNHEVVDNKPYDSDKSKIPLFLADMTKKGLPVVASLPEYWWYHWGDDIQSFVRWGISGFEIINSAPKALDFPLSKRLEIVDLCRRQNLFMTGISDNHGYGYATAVWNAMRIPGWQSMDPDALENAVLKTLKTKRFEAVQVLERTHFLPENPFELVVTPVCSLWIYARGLQPLQALSWIIWIWTIYFLYPSRRSGTQRSGPKP